MLLTVITCVNKRLNDVLWGLLFWRKKTYPTQWESEMRNKPDVEPKRAESKRAMSVCVVHFSGHSIWVLDGEKIYFSQQCLSQYRALLFIGQISSETEVFGCKCACAQKNIFTKILQKFAFELENKSRREKKANRKELQSIARETRRLCFGLENIRRANYVKESVQIRARPKKRCVTKKSKIFFISRLTPNSGKWAREGSEKKFEFFSPHIRHGEEFVLGKHTWECFFFLENI